MSRRWTNLFLVMAVAWCLTAVGLVHAQPTSEPPADETVPAASSSTREAAAQAVAEAGPEIFYLQDDAGRLVPVPGFRYRDFIDLMRLKEGLPGQPEPPAAVLETITLSGTLPAVAPASDTAPRSCAATVVLTIRQTRSGWVSVPVDLRGFFIAAPPRHEGPGQILFAADKGGADGFGRDDQLPAPRGGSASTMRPEGYRIWINAPVAAGEELKHVVTLEGSLPVEASAFHENVTVVMPMATASRMEFRTPRIDPLVTVLPGLIPPAVAAADPGEPAAGSIVTIVGASGPVRIRMSDRSAPAAPLGVVPQSTVESLVRIDGRTSVIEAVLRLENLPPDTATLRIALPPQSTLRAVRPPATLVERTGTAESPIAVVGIDRDLDGTATVELECERTVDASGRTPFESLGFVVADIPPWRQRGRVSLVVEGDWQVEWEELGANRRIDPPVLGRRAGFVAAFAYDAQPASLPLRVRSRGSRVIVEPDYRYEVGAARITLDARLRVSVRGAPASRIVVALDGWEVDEVGPAGLVDTVAVTFDNGRLVIPFQQGLSGDAVIDVRCGRSIDRAADRVEWRIPSPQAALVGPAAVLISAESDIELTPDPDAIRGLVRQVAPTPMRADADRLVLAYRLDGAEGTFAAQRRFLPRRIDASVRAQVEIDESTMFVTETIRFSVAHVPLEFIELLVPADVARSGTLEIRQGGQLLNPINDAFAAEFDVASEGATEDADEAEAEAVDGGVTIRAMLPVPLLGSGEVVVTYQQPTPSVPPETTVAEDLPLIIPLAAQISRQSLQVTAVDALAVDVRGEAWKRDAAVPSATAARAWTSARVQEIAPLALAARQQEAGGETIVEAAWLQTRLLADLREEIHAFAISSSSDRLSLVLPGGFIADRAGRPDPAAVEVRLDGRQLAGAVRSDGRVSVELPPGGRRQTVLLEIRGSRPRDGSRDAWLAGWGATGRVVLEPPTFPDGTQQRRFYWEVHLQSDEHVIVPPRRWTGQQRWMWGTFGLERQPQVSRQVLAAWVRGNAGLSRDDQRDELDASLVGRRAVYSGVGPPGVESLWAAPTWLVVLVASTPVLAVGLAMVYGRLASSVPVMVAIAACLTVAAALKPELAPLALQAAVPGAALTLLAAVMRGLVVRSRPAAFRPAAQPAPTSSLTRVAAQPSIIVAPSALRSADSVTSPGRSAS